MMPVARNRILLPGVLWGFVLAALATTEPFGLTGSLVVALLPWALMAPTICGFTFRDSAESSALMSPGIFPDGFFVAVSAFVYTLVGGLLLGPILGPLVERAANKEKELVR